MILEACVENISEALDAEKLGASRIELCDNLHVGGTTPSYGTITVALNKLKIPIMVLIRPRGGNFVYSEPEVEIMKKDIIACRDLGVKGVVIGALLPDQTIDTKLISELMLLAKPMEITFHKAIDDTADILSEIKKLKKLGVNRVLTSGGKKTAIDGADTINKMVDICQGKVGIVAAGKITYLNLELVRQLIRADEFHGKLIVGKLR